MSARSGDEGVAMKKTIRVIALLFEGRRLLSCTMYSRDKKGTAIRRMRGSFGVCTRI